MSPGGRPRNAQKPGTEQEGYNYVNNPVNPREYYCWTAPMGCRQTTQTHVLVCTSRTREGPDAVLLER